MTNRATLLPALVVIVIVVLVIIVISSGSSKDTGLVADDSYPHYFCNMNTYCEGPDCTRNTNIPFIAYLSHADGEPRLEFPRMSPTVTVSEVPDGLRFESVGGEVQGYVSVFRDGGMDFMGTSGEASNPVEHFASGRCQRLHTP